MGDQRGQRFPEMLLQQVRHSAFVRQHSVVEKLIQLILQADLAPKGRYRA